MNEKKPIRRHSQLRRFVTNAGYYSVKGLRLPIGFLLLGLMVVVGFLALLSGLALVIWALGFPIGSAESLREMAQSGGIIVILFSVLAAGDYFLFRLCRAYTDLPEGHLLNPLPPAPNEILPEAETLVRASSVSDTDQKKTLLRPAGSANETDPQTLLRASNPTD